MRRSFVLLAGVLAGGLFPSPLAAESWFMPAPRTLRDEAADAAIILYGRLVRPPGDKRETGEKIEPGTRDLIVEQALKESALLRPPRRITLPGERADAREGSRWVLFCDVFKGQLDPYAGRFDPTGELPDYLKKALALPAGNPARSVRFFFDHLDHPNETIAADARIEMERVDPADLQVVGPTLPANRIARRLQAPGLAPQRRGLYARLLGYCGTKKHLALLRKLLDEPLRSDDRGVDDILCAYVMLEPKEGWAYLRDIYKDGKKDFLFRYRALRAARFLWEFRPDLVTRRDLAEGVAVMLDQQDMADLVVEDLRKWRWWDMTDRVLALQGKKVYEVPIVRRTVLRFALCCPNKPAVEFYIAEQRKKDPQWVADVEELLKLE